MDHATSYQHCTPPAATEADAPLPTELEMLNYYATEIGVLIGGMDQTQKECTAVGIEPDPMIPCYMRTLRRIRKGIEGEIVTLSAVMQEPRE